MVWGIRVRGAFRCQTKAIRYVPAVTKSLFRCHFPSTETVSRKICFMVQIGFIVVLIYTGAINLIQALPIPHKHIKGHPTSSTERQVKTPHSPAPQNIYSTPKIHDSFHPKSRIRIPHIPLPILYVKNKQVLNHIPRSIPNLPTQRHCELAFLPRLSAQPCIGEIGAVSHVDLLHLREVGGRGLDSVGVDFHRLRCQRDGRRGQEGGGGAVVC